MIDSLSFGGSAARPFMNQHVYLLQRVHEPMSAKCNWNGISSLSLVSRNVFSGLRNVLQVVGSDGTRDGVPLTFHCVLGVSDVLSLLVDPQKASVTLRIPATTQSQACTVMTAPLMWL